MDLMQWEKDVILNSMLRKSSAVIANTLGIEEEVVAGFIKANRPADLVTMDQLLEKKRKPKP